MESLLPLIILAIIISMLLFMARLLSGAKGEDKKPETVSKPEMGSEHEDIVAEEEVSLEIGQEKTAAEEIETEEEAKGQQLFSGLTAVGLDERGVNTLRNLIGQKDENRLAVFMACNKFILIELENCITNLRRQYHTLIAEATGKLTDEEKLALIKKINFIDVPPYVNFKALSQQDLLIMLENELSDPRMITLEFTSRFGGQEFMSNFEFYDSKIHRSALTFSVSPNDRQREKFDKLVDSGAAVKGNKIPLSDRLAVLTVKQLKEFAKKLDIDYKFKNKSEAIIALSNNPKTAELFSEQYNEDDLYMLKPMDIDIKKLKCEWMLLKVYAKLLSHIVTSPRPLDSSAG